MTSRFYPLVTAVLLNKVVGSEGFAQEEALAHRDRSLGTMELEAVAWMAILAVLLRAADGLKGGGAAGDSPTPSSQGQPAPTPSQHHQHLSAKEEMHPVLTHNLWPSRPVFLHHSACLLSGAGWAVLQPVGDILSPSWPAGSLHRVGWLPRSVKFHSEALQRAPLKGCSCCQGPKIESRLLWSSRKHLYIVHVFLHRNSCLLLMQFGYAWLERPAICWPAAQIGSSLITDKHL